MTQLQSLIKSNLDVLDALVEQREEYVKEIQELPYKIIKVDKEKGDAISLLKKQKTLSFKANLVAQDLSRALNKVNALYELANLDRVELTFEEDTIKRLDAMLQADTSLFVVGKEGVIPKDQSMMEGLIEKVQSEKSDVYQKILASIRESDIYKKEDGAE